MRLKKHESDPEIPTSSMADIAFLLIVYFMVTATFAATRGLDFALPKDDDNPPIVEKEDSVLIHIDDRTSLELGLCTREVCKGCDRGDLVCIEPGG